MNTHSHSMLTRRASHMDRKPYARPAHIEGDMPSPSLGNLPQAMQDVNLSHAGSSHHMGANQPSVLDPILSNPSSLNLFHTSERTSTGAFPVVLEMCRFDWNRVMDRVWREPGWSSEPPLSPNNRRETNHQPTCAGRYGAHNALYEAHEQEQAYLPPYQQYANLSPCRPFHSGQYGNSPPDHMGGYQQSQLPPSLQRSSSYAGQVNNAGYWQSSQPMRRNTHDAFGPVHQAQSYPMVPSSQTMTSSSSFAGPSDNTGLGSSNSIKLSLPMGDNPQAVSPYSRPMQAEEASSSTNHCAEPVYDPLLLTESSSYNNPGRPSIRSIESSLSGYSQVTHGSADADREDDGTDSDRQLSAMSCSYNGSSSCWNLPYQTSYIDSSSGGSSSDLSNNIAYPLANAQASSSRTREATVTVRNFGFWQEIESNVATGSGSGSGSASASALSTTESAPALLAPDWLAAIQNVSDPSSDSDESPLSTNVIEEAIQLGLMNPANPAQTAMMVEDAFLLAQSVFGTTADPIPSPLATIVEIDTEIPAATQDDQVSQVVAPQPAGLATPSRVVRPTSANGLEFFTPNTRQLINFLESGEGFGAISALGDADHLQSSAVIQGAEVQQ